MYLLDSNISDIKSEEVKFCRISANSCSFKVLFINCWFCNCRPYVREIAGRKNMTIFKGCHYFWFYIMFSSSFRKIETKNLNSDPRILIFLVLGTTSPAAH